MAPPFRDGPARLGRDVRSGVRRSAPGAKAESRNVPTELLPMTAARTLTQVGITPRLLTREQAAGYCGLRVTTFTAWVRRGIVPGPVSGTHRWDRKAIDLALDALSRLDDKLGPNALDQWEAKHHKRHAERNSSS
jgi:hypothetical protein